MSKVKQTIFTDLKILNGFSEALAILPNYNPANTIMFPAGSLSADPRLQYCDLTTYKNIDTSTQVSASLDPVNHAETDLHNYVHLVEFEDDVIESIQWAVPTLGSYDIDAGYPITIVDVDRTALIHTGLIFDEQESFFGSTMGRVHFGNPNDVILSRGVGANTFLAANVQAVQFAHGILASPIQHRIVELEGPGNYYTETLDNAVDPNSSLLINCGCSSLSAYHEDAFYGLEFIDKAHVKMSRAGNGPLARTINYDIIPFVPGIIKSIRTANLSLNPGQIAATYSAGFNAKKHICLSTGSYSSGSLTDTLSGVRANPLITQERGTAIAPVNHCVQLVEFE